MMVLVKGAGRLWTLASRVRLRSVYEARDEGFKDIDIHGPGNILWCWLCERSEQVWLLVFFSFLYFLLSNGNKDGTDTYIFFFYLQQK